MRWLCFGLFPSFFCRSMVCFFLLIFIQIGIHVWYAQALSRGVFDLCTVSNRKTYLRVNIGALLAQKPDHLRFRVDHRLKWIDTTVSLSSSFLPSYPISSSLFERTRILAGAQVLFFFAPISPHCPMLKQDEFILAEMRSSNTTKKVVDCFLIPPNPSLAPPLHSFFRLFSVREHKSRAN